MSTGAIILMIILLGIVWGGFIIALMTAMKKESQKTESGS